MPSLLADSRAYHFDPEVLDCTQPALSSRVRYPEAGTADAEALALEKLGVKGWGRLEHFKLCYAGGWGKGPQKPMSPRSLDTLVRALAVIHPPENAKPSVFLTDGGSLELAWRDDQGRAVQIEFGPRESEVYDEARGIERTVPNEELPAYLKSLY
jgi:hypothetical protein